MTYIDDSEKRILAAHAANQQILPAVGIKGLYHFKLGAQLANMFEKPNFSTIGDLRYCI